jgi:hypothetical protein
MLAVASRHITITDRLIWFRALTARDVSIRTTRDNVPGGP